MVHLRRFAAEARRGWVDARMMAVLPGRDRALRFVAVLLFAQRASYLLPALSSLGSVHAAHYRSQAVNAGLLAVCLLWNVALGAAVWRRGWFSRVDVAVDVALTCGLLFWVNANIEAGFELTAANWAAKFALGSAALVGAVLSLPMVLAVLPVLVLAAVVAAAVRIGGLPPFESGFVNHVNSSLWFALLLHFMRRFLCAQASAVDEATARQVAAESAAAAAQARLAERLRHVRQLHDTVLATLTAISRGGLDHRTEAVRARCARDADYLRRLVVDERSGERPDEAVALGARLAAVAADAAALDVRVHLLAAAVPDVPDAVGAAICDATREALNNVARHAGTGQAWVSTEWDGTRLTVRVVDRGVGFVTDQPLVRPGSGLRRSIDQRMREVGGDVRVFAEPGHGTCVELTWST